MQYTHVLLSGRDERFYTRCTDDLGKRLREHNQACVRSTAS
jgi:predicted GIY-YIG superfamily endonuclease